MARKFLGHTEAAPKPPKPPKRKKTRQWPKPKTVTLDEHYEERVIDGKAETVLVRRLAGVDRRAWVRFRPFGFRLFGKHYCRKRGWHQLGREG
jgi:hypothetical protein